MNVKQYLDHCSEQNWQVHNEQDIRSCLTMSNVTGGNGEGFKNPMAGETPVLEARVKSLKQSISLLKSELLEEKNLWKKEVELMANLISNDRSLEINSDLNSEAEMDAKSLTGVSVTGTDTLVPSSALIRDFEEKLNRYQGAFVQAQAEKRLNIRRQIAANTYRKRLNEVEKLCQEELNKVRKTATYLEPLKQIASEWTKSKESGYYAESPEPEQTKYLPEKTRKSSANAVECGGDFTSVKGSENLPSEDVNYPYEVPVKQIDASLVMDEDASNEIKGKIVLQIGSLPSEVPTICYSAKFE
ncbi:hypothetical protein RUM44_003238 [Polyplax serrata]|uniref:Uncharacterized protein n=1 Tax=Polyplax serrata TaxID=468196 RepID=A0ABR1AXY2_POLSC